MTGFVLSCSNVSDISFSDALHGVAGFYGFFIDGTVFVTEDGGMTWQPQQVPAKASGSAVAAVPDGFVVGGHYGLIVKATRVNPADANIGEPADLASRGGEADLKARSALGSRVDVEFVLPAAGPADLSVIDVLGRRVASLRSGSFTGRTPYRTSWDGTDDRGGRAPSGVYFVRLQYGARAKAARAVMAK